MATTEKTFRFAGVSRYNGEMKVRYANQQSRAAHLAKVGHTDIVFVDLGSDYEKVDCVDKLIGVDLGSEEANETVLKEAREYGFIV